MDRLKAAGCDFAAIVCNTAHAFLPGIAGRLPLPVVHAVLETAAAAAGGHPGVRRYGLLATTGTCRSGLFQRAFAARGLEVVCPPEAEGAAGNVQERLVMAAIYGRLKAGRRVGGIKGGAVAGPRTLLLKAARDLIDHRGAEGLIVGCSEVSLAIGVEDVPVPLVDSMEVLAGAVLDLVAGRRALADLPPPAAWPAPPV
jgi:aspartate racemase